MFKYYEKKGKYHHYFRYYFFSFDYDKEMINYNELCYIYEKKIPKIDKIKKVIDDIGLDYPILFKIKKYHSRKSHDVGFLFENDKWHENAEFLYHKNDIYVQKTDDEFGHVLSIKDILNYYTRGRSKTYYADLNEKRIANDIKEISNILSKERDIKNITIDDIIVINSILTFTKKISDYNYTLFYKYINVLNELIKNNVNITVIGRKNELLYKKNRSELCVSRNIKEDIDVFERIMKRNIQGNLF